MSENITTPDPAPSSPKCPKCGEPHHKSPGSTVFNCDSTHYDNAPSEICWQSAKCRITELTNAIAELEQQLAASRKRIEELEKVLQLAHDEMSQATWVSGTDRRALNYAIKKAYELLKGPTP
jgi:hypothetical protein